MIFVCVYKTKCNYVGEMLILGEETKQLVENLKKEFDTKDLREIKQLLGVEFERDKQRTTLRRNRF